MFVTGQPVHAPRSVAGPKCWHRHLPLAWLGVGRAHGHTQRPALLKKEVRGMQERLLMGSHAEAWAATTGTGRSGHAPHKAVASVEGVADLGLPVVVVRDEPGPARALVGDAPPLLARPVDLPAQHRHRGCSCARLWQCAPVHNKHAPPDFHVYKSAWVGAPRGGRPGCHTKLWQHGSYPARWKRPPPPSPGTKHSACQRGACTEWVGTTARPQCWLLLLPRWRTRAVVTLMGARAVVVY